MAEARTPGPRYIAGVVVVALVLVVGGVWAYRNLGEDAGGGDGPDRGDPFGVAEYAVKAMWRGDTEAMRRVMTRDAWMGFDAEVMNFQAKQLADPTFRRTNLVGVSDQRIDQARNGTTGDVCRFLIEIMKLPEEPRMRGLKTVGSAMEVIYEGANGVHRPVRLRKIDGQWTVVAFQTP